jgi:uncharacterized phage-associated protein
MKPAIRTDLPPSNRPTSEFEQHHQIDAPEVTRRSFRTAWRLRTRLDQLLADGLIDRADWQAASEFRDCWERCHGTGLGPVELEFRSRVNGADRWLGNRLDTARQLREIAEGIGRRSTWLIEACAVFDMPWVRLAKQIGVSDKTARIWVSEAIARLQAFVATKRS